MEVSPVDKLRDVAEKARSTWSAHPPLLPANNKEKMAAMFAQDLKAQATYNDWKRG